MKKGDIVVRIQNKFIDMKEGDMAEIIENRSGNLSLTIYKGSHDGNRFRLATEEEKEQYYAKQGIVVNKEVNYQIY